MESKIKCKDKRTQSSSTLPTTAQAPLADEQIPALPPNKAAKKPKTTVVHRPTSGLTPATTVYVCNSM